MKNALIVVLFTGLVFFIGWWISDEELDPVAKNWIERTHQESQAYNYLLGIGVKPGQSPQQVGNQYYQKQQTSDMLFFPDTFDSLGQHELLCDYQKPSCLLQQQNNRENALALLHEYHHVIERYQHFIHMDDFADNTPLNMDANFPNYNLLLVAGRLQSLQWALADTPGEALADDIEQLRKLLTADHNLISKLVVARILDEKIRLAALLVQQDKAITISRYRLSTEEKSLRAAMIKEFRLRANFLLQEDYMSYPESSLWDVVRFRLGLRKNITLNRDLGFTRHYADLSENPASVIAADNYSMPAPTASQTIRNPVGNFLLEIAAPSMKEYLIRVAHLDAKLQLLGWFRHQDVSLPNPWSESGKPGMTVSDEEVCFTTTTNTPEHRSCLPLITANGNP